MAVRPIRPATAIALTMCSTTPDLAVGVPPEALLRDDVEQVVGRQRLVRR